MVGQISLGLTSRGTLDKTAASLEGKVKADHYDKAKQFLTSLDEGATVRIVNGRSKDQELVLSTKSNSGNFYSRKPVTKEFFKQACIGRFGDVPAAETARAFEAEYGKVRNGAGMHTARHFLAVMEALEKKFASEGSAADKELEALKQDFDNFLFGQALQVPEDMQSEGRLSTFSHRFRDDASFLEEFRRTRKSLSGSPQSERFSLNEAAKNVVREEQEDDRYSLGSDGRLKSFDERGFGAPDIRDTERRREARMTDLYAEALRNPRSFGSEVSGSEDIRSSDASDKSV